MARASAKALGEQDAFPEFDRLDGFPHPRETLEIKGQDRAAGILLNALLSGRMPHAWLLSGAEGIGKATLAYAFARYVLTNPGAESDVSDGFVVPAEHPVVGKVKALSHPNLLVLRRPWSQKDKRFLSAIPVDEVRRLQPFFGLTAGEDSWRIVIVDRADDLNENAANALLKLLEEPPSRSIFLLICSTPAKVLTTIRSRCRALSLVPLETGALSLAVQKACEHSDVAAPDGVSFEKLAALSCGSVRRALELHSGNGVALYEQLVGLFRALPNLNLREVDDLAEKLGAPSKEAEFVMFFSLFSDLLHRVIRGGAVGVSGIPDEAELSEKLVSVGSLAKWAELWETVGHTQRQALALNLDRKILILETFQRLKGTASGSPS